MTDEIKTEKIETPQDAVAQVKADREALKAENDAYDAEMLRSEKIRAERAKGGQSVMVKPEEKKEMTNKEYAKEVLAGRVPKNETKN